MIRPQTWFTAFKAALDAYYAHRCNYHWRQAMRARRHWLDCRGRWGR